MTFHSNWKPSRTARLKAKHETKVARVKHERAEKAESRRRDRVCRFPLCGCRKLKLPLEVAHGTHKGMGGNPAGDRSLSHLMVLLCNHRHQFGAVSFHKGTLRVRFLTDAGFDGPVVWEVNTGSEWEALAIEVRAGVIDIKELNSRQRSFLGNLAKMED